MKKTRIFPIIALLLAVVFSAFTGNHKQMVKQDGPLWYYTEQTTDNEDEPSSYIPLDGEHAECVGGSAVRCVIEAPEGGPDEPDLSNITEFVSYKP